MHQLNQPIETYPSTKEVLKPLLYADIFDFPLTFEEIYKFLEFEASPGVVKSLLDQAIRDREVIVVDQYYSLAGKPHLADLRQERFRAAQELWPKALHYGRWIASLPFVRMVAITGSLAVDNPRHSRDDIDYLIVTSPKRLWLCRALIILLVRYGHRQGVHLCPNYLITEKVILFEENNLYIARELLQMVPIYGQDHYLDLRKKNAWVTDYLPQGNKLNLDKINDVLSPMQQAFKRLGEFIFGGPIGNLAEKILQKKQISKHLKLAKKYGALDKVTFTADECKGHYDNHGRKTLAAYRKRIDDHQADHNHGVEISN